MSKILVVLSGGQDSVTCLGLALQEALEKRVEQSEYTTVEAIGFRYGQKHEVELFCAGTLCSRLGVPFVIHEIPSLSILGDSALTTDGDVSQQHHRSANLPASFVPNRNALFLTIAHAYAQKIGADKIVTGVCQTDYSGYPDCRAEFIWKLQDALNTGYQTSIVIDTPLMHLTKAETFQVADECGFLETVINDSHTCYNGDRSVKHDWGFGCGKCPACELRAKGYAEFLAGKGN